MREAEDRRKAGPDDRELGGKIRAYAMVGVILLMALVIGTPVVMTITFFNWPVVIAWLAVVLVLYRLVKRRAETLDRAYLDLQSERLDYRALIGETIQLESFRPGETFLMAELAGLCSDRPDRSILSESAISGRMSGRWRGMRLESAYVNYVEEGSTEVDYVASLFKGQLTMLDAPTGFSGRLLLVQAPDRGGGLTKLGHGILLEQTGLKGKAVDGTPLTPGAWQVYSDRYSEARALLDANPAFVRRVRNPCGLTFMLIERDRVTFLGDYGFKRVNYQQGIEAARGDCLRAMRLLESEGLETAAALCETAEAGGAGANEEAKRDEEG